MSVGPEWTRATAGGGATGTDALDFVVSSLNSEHTTQLCHSMRLDCQFNTSTHSMPER